MSFEDTWDTKSPCRTVQSQSPGKVAFGAHRKSMHYSSDSMQPRTLYGGGLMPQSHQDFDPWKKEEKFDPGAAAPHPHDSMYAANKQEMPFRTEQEAWVITPTMGSTVVLKTSGVGTVPTWKNAPIILDIRKHTMDRQRENPTFDLVSKHEIRWGRLRYP